MSRSSLLASLCLCGWLSAGAEPLPAHAPTVVEYDIAVSLEPEQQRLVGHERLTWHNPSTDYVDALWFHLYLNGFRNTASTFFRESGGRLRRDRAFDEGWGTIDIRALHRDDGSDLLPNAAFEHPDDDNALDRTVLRVPLGRAVPPGGSVAVEIDFVARLPKVYARAGYRRDFFMVGQWFPKLGVYEPAGTRGRTQGGWNCHQFHANSEFYADYGRYRVELTLPARFVVGATGRRSSLRSNPDGTRTHVYEQEDVHDFAWTADPAFVEVRRRFDAAARVTSAEYTAAARMLGRTEDELHLSDVEVLLLVQPNHVPQAGRQADILLEAIERFGLWYGRYPYGTLTVVDPAPGARGASGMEYPTLFTSATSFLFQHWPFERVRLPEEVVVHEYGHQYWYGLVGSNEFEEPWLDEGFNTYSTSRLLDLAFGPRDSAAQLLGLRLGQLDTQRLGNHLDRRFDRIRSTAWGFSPGQYGFNSYARPSLVLRTLERLLGEETMARVLRTYAERWRFGHPRSEDFYAVASEVSGRDLGPFFRQTVESRGVLDYAVTGLESEPAREIRGWVERDGREQLVTRQDAQARETASERLGQQLYESRVELRRLGEALLPVEVELRFAGLPPERRAWDGQQPLVRWEFRRPERLVSVTIDPDHVLVLDANWLNNSRRLEPDRRAAAHWGVRLLFWIEQALAAVTS